MIGRVRMPSLGGATEWLNSEPLGPAEHGVDVDERANGLLRDGRICQLVRNHDTVRDRTLEVTFLEPGSEAYVFTFGLGG